MRARAPSATNFNGKAFTSGKVECFLVEFGDSEDCYDSRRFLDKLEASQFFVEIGEREYKRFYAMLRILNPGVKSLRRVRDRRLLAAAAEEEG